MKNIGTLVIAQMDPLEMDIVWIKIKPIFFIMARVGISGYSIKREKITEKPNSGD